MPAKDAIAAIKDDSEATDQERTWQAIEALASEIDQLRADAARLANGDFSGLLPKP